MCSAGGWCAGGLSHRASDAVCCTAAEDHHVPDRRAILALLIDACLLPGAAAGTTRLPRASIIAYSHVINGTDFDIAKLNLSAAVSMEVWWLGSFLPQKSCTYNVAVTPA